MTDKRPYRVEFLRAHGGWRAYSLGFRTLGDAERFISNTLRQWASDMKTGRRKRQPIEQVRAERFRISYENER